MHHLQPQMVAEAINDLGPRFDAHAVEKRLLRRYTVETAREILRYADSGDVLRAFSAQLARYVNRTFRGQIRSTTPKVISENLGGKDAVNTQWERLVARVVAPPVMSIVGAGSEVEGDDAEHVEDERRRSAIHAVALRNAAGRMDEEP